MLTHSEGFQLWGRAVFSGFNALFWILAVIVVVGSGFLPLDPKTALGRLFSSLSEYRGWIFVGVALVMSYLGMVKAIRADRKRAARSLYATNPEARLYRAHYRICQLYRQGEGLRGGPADQLRQWDQKVIAELERHFDSAAGSYLGATNRAHRGTMLSDEHHEQALQALKTMLVSDFDYRQALNIEDD